MTVKTTVDVESLKKDVKLREHIAQGKLLKGELVALLGEQEHKLVALALDKLAVADVDETLAVLTAVKAYKTGLAKLEKVMETVNAHSNVVVSKELQTLQTALQGAATKKELQELLLQGMATKAVESSVAAVPPQVLFTSFEAEPFMTTGELGLFAGRLPVALAKAGCDVRVMLPKLVQITQEYVEQMHFVCSFDVELGARKLYCGLFQLELHGVTYYFLDNEHYFFRGDIYYQADDGERMAFFSKAIVTALAHLEGFTPNILHCNDWHTALVPAYLKVGAVENAPKTVLTLQNVYYQGVYGTEMLNFVLGLAGTEVEQALRQGDHLNFMKAGILASDLVTTKSANYAAAICTEAEGKDLDKVLASKGDRLVGIAAGSGESWETAAAQYLCVYERVLSK